MRTLKIIGIILFLSALNANSLSYADKFGSSISSDYMTQDTSSSLKNKPSIPQASSIPMATGIQQPVVPVTAQAASIPTAYLPKTPSEISTQIQPITSPADLKQLKISVPNYEKQYQDMMRKQEEKGKKKKKTLIESILFEIKQYGMLLVLLMVTLIVFYAVHKDKAPPPTPTETEKKADMKKKSIWDDEF